MFLFESLVYVFICLYFALVSDQWKLLQVPNIVFATLGIVYLFWMPESPRFLVAQKKFGEARKVFEWIGEKNGLSPGEAKRRLDTIKFEGESEIDVILAA